MSSPAALLVGETQFPFHDIDDVGPHIEAALGDAAAVTRSARKADLADLSAYDLVVDYLTDSTLTEAQLESLTGFVADGGGYLGLHPAAGLRAVGDGDGGLDHREEPIPELRELLGGRFVGHPERTTFGVGVVAAHPVTEGVADFEVFDEPYEVTVDDDVSVLARMDRPDAPDYPVVWTRSHGDGRVCYASLGHDEEAFANGEYRRLLRNAVGWVVGDR